MEVFCTSVIPIKFSNNDVAKEFIQTCEEQHIVSDYRDYTGEIYLQNNPDINTSFLKLYYIPSPSTDIQCAFCERTLTIVLTWRNVYEDYYEMVNHLLTERKGIVKRVVDYHPKDEHLQPLLQLLEQYKEKGSGINYAFTFYSIHDPQYTASSEMFLKVLAEPSLINMDDMLSSEDTCAEFNSETEINHNLLSSIQNIDISNDQETYVTWASIVSVSKRRETFVRNHITTTLLEVLLQRIWNLCYSKNNELNTIITNIKSYIPNVNATIIDTYQILIESKNSVSATYSSRISRLYKAMVESSQLVTNINDLEQKLNYLIVFANSINQNKNRRVQESSEMLLFMIAIAQVVPLFFHLPIVTHYWISTVVVVSICIAGILLIRYKYRH